MELVNVINLNRRQERMESFIEQSIEQGFEYKRWEGIIDLAATFRGISNAHKQIIRHAAAIKQKECFVAEDDCVFTCVGAWQYFLSRIPESYDMFFASFYEGKSDENNRLIKGNDSNELLSGLTLYSIHERFYNKFLSIKDMDHLDKQIGLLANEYEFYVCNPFTAIQYNGYSDNKKRDCNYDRYMKGRKLFGVNS